MMGLGTRYLVAIVAVVVIAGAFLSLAFRGPGDMTAVWVSAAVALAVQVAAFAVTRSVGGGGGNLVTKMGTGALLRFLALVVYAVLTATVLHLPLVAALISIATFFFLTTLIEPLLIRR